MKTRFLVSFAAMIATPSADACSPPPPGSATAPTAEELAAQDRSSFRQAVDLVEVHMLTAATIDRIGRAVVLRSVKGGVRVGQTIRMQAVSTSMCGAGDAAKGAKYRLFLRSKSPFVFSPLDADGQARLFALGLMPASWIAASR